MIESLELTNFMSVPYAKHTFLNVHVNLLDVAESWEREMNVLKRCCAVDSDITFFAAEILRRTGKDQRNLDISCPVPTFESDFGICDVSSASECQDTVRSTIDQRMNLRVQ